MIGVLPRGSGGPRVPDPVLPLRYFGAAAVSLLLAALALPFHAELLADFYYQTRILALTHLITLGWITMTMMGALFQLVPVALGTALSSPRLAGLQFWLMVAGVAGMVGHFWIGRFEGMAASALLVLLAVLLFLTNMIRTLRGVRQWDIVAWHIGAALVYLAATAGLGSLMALDKVLDFLPGDFLGILQAHAHLAALGWVTMTIVGVSYKLIPMFTLSELWSDRLARSTFWSLNGAVLGLFWSLLAGSRLVAAFAALAAASLALYGFQMIRTLRARRRPALDWGIRYALTALGYLMLTALVGAALAAGVVRDEALAARLAFAYGFLGLGAWVSMMMMGMLYKIVPFLVWYLAYSDRVGLARVPDLGELCSVRLQRWGYWLLHLGTLGTAVGLAGGGAAFLRATTSLLAVAVLLFVLNMAGAFRHLARPVGLPVPSAGGGRA